MHPRLKTPERNLPVDKIKQLISCIEKYPEIWNKSIQTGHMYVVSSWMKISEETQLNGKKIIVIFVYFKENNTISM